MSDYSYEVLWLSSLLFLHFLRISNIVIWFEINFLNKQVKKYSRSSPTGIPISYFVNFNKNNLIHL